MVEPKEKKKRFSMVFSKDLQEMVAFIQEETGITTMSQAVYVAIRQYYRSLRADK